jgi:hypothetical protein
MKLWKSAFALILLFGAALVLHGCQTAPTSPPVATATPRPAIDDNVLNELSRRCGDPLPADRQFAVRPWHRTDFCQHSVDYTEIHSGGVSRDRIPSIDQPIFEDTRTGSVWLADTEPVIAFQLGEDARAYPLQVLVWHEIVNDMVNDVPVVVTYCPLCDSALVFERTVDGQVLDFGTTGNLRNADLVMYDRQTESWWQQFTGEAIVGELTGRKLSLLAASVVSWGDFKQRFPAGKVLTADTGYERPYGETPYINYDSLVNPRAHFFAGELDKRLPPKMRVLAVRIGDVAMAYPFSKLSQAGAVNDVLAEQPLVVFWKAGTVSPLYRQTIAESKDVGSAAAFSRVLDGETLSFLPTDAGFQDRETGSIWNIFGIATDGPLAGRALLPLPGHEFLWFAWAAFQPDTQIYDGP